jgi:hypothetical protein
MDPMKKRAEKKGSKKNVEIKNGSALRAIARGNGDLI